MVDYDDQARQTDLLEQRINSTSGEGKSAHVQERAGHYANACSELDLSIFLGFEFPIRCVLQLANGAFAGLLNLQQARSGLVDIPQHWLKPECRDHDSRDAFVAIPCMNVQP
jgi:hypothetical protein